MTRRSPPPLTEDEMRAMRADGDAISTIMQRAHMRNGLSRDAVRQILFGKEAQ